MTEIKLAPLDLIVLEQGNEYALLKRYARYEPYVVAFCYDPASCSWAAGHYFNDLKAALEFFRENDSKFDTDRILSADDFATAVMKRGTEIESNECETLDWQQIEPNETVWTIYVHINEDGGIVHSKDLAEWTLTTNMKLTEEQSAALMQGELDNLERSIIIEEIYPRYVKLMKEEIL